jgi:hypothetical protein
MPTLPHPLLSIFLKSAATVVAAVLFAFVTQAATQVDLSNRIVIDGLTDEWDADESLFQTNPETGGLEESISDSEWGFNNDLNQIRLTWDARFLYVGVDAIIWGNNVIVLFDFRDGGMEEMTNLNSWRRNFVFQGLEPDLFLATWDGNTLPQAWDFIGSNQVTRKDATSFATVASFSQGNQGRAMEAALPWEFLLGEDAERVFDAAVGDTVFVLPAGISRLRVVGVVTAGPDGTGGPDSAPDNLSGHEIDSAFQVTVDNWAEVPLDLDGDGVVDFGESVRDRSSFRVLPPVRGIRLEIRNIELARPVISPEQGGQLEFSVALSPEVPQDEDFRSVTLSAEIFNLNGEKVRTLYSGDTRSAANPLAPELDCWDGRDERGSIVPGGVYILRLVIEPEANRSTKAFTVVR